MATMLLLLQIILPSSLAYAETTEGQVSIATVNHESVFKIGEDIVFNIEGSLVSEGKMIQIPAGLTQVANENAHQMIFHASEAGNYQMQFETKDGLKSNLLNIQVVEAENNASTEELNLFPTLEPIDETAPQVGAPKDHAQTRQLTTTIVGSPDPITSKAEVVLDVTVAADAGEFKPENGPITIKIPREMIYTSADLTSTVLPAPFVLDSVQTDTTDFILTISIDFTNIDVNDAFYGTFQIKFGAPLLREGDEHKDAYDVTLDYAGEQIKETLNIQKMKPGTQPSFAKWPRGKKDENGIYLLDKDVPSSVNNTFQLIVNYAQIGFKDLTVVDTLPSGTTIEDAARFPAATGDRTAINHVRIIRVNRFDPVTGSALDMEYVTSDFKDDIHFDPTTNQVSVAFGDVPPEIGYVIEYGTKVVNPDMGVQYNQANFYSEGKLKAERAVPVRISGTNSTNFIFSKSVDKQMLNYDDTTLNYTLKAQLLSGTSIPQGTEFVDQLDSRLRFDSIVNLDTSKFSYEITGNTLTFKTLKDIPVNEINKIVFKVDASQLKMGEEVKNTITTTLNGNSIQSGVAATKKYDGRIEIAKVDEKKQPLAGATFEIQDSKQIVVYTGTTNEQGLLLSSALPLGSYTIIETKAPEGYVLDPTEKSVEITEVDTVPIQLMVENQLKTGSVILKKVDQNNGHIVLPNAVFDLLSEDGTILQTDLITDKNGMIQVDALAPGKYSFVETKAPADYLLDATPVSFEIQKNQQQPLEVIKTNQLETSVITLTKVDEDSGEILTGAEFELRTEQGEVVQKGLITNDVGKISVNNLPVGNYQFVEVKAPEGYVLDATPVKFEVVGKETIETKKTNKLTPGSVILEKIDAQSKSVLAGAEFNLQDAAGNVIATQLKTDQNGEIKVTDLKPGNYQFIETKAPIGYQLDTVALKFTIEKNQQAPLRVVKTNHLLADKPSQPIENKDSSGKPGKLPDTGERTSRLIGGIGIVIVAVGIYVIGKNRRKQ